MENKINVAKILKDCPKGMELNCTMYENVEFDYIEQNSELTYPIHCLMKINGGYNALVFTRNGCNDRHPNAKCVIFPKGKTTWEGFQRPFKDGDILSFQHEGFINRTIYIYMQHSRMNTTYYVALSGNLDPDFMINDKEGYALNGYNDSVRFATEKEKQQLFAAIKNNGYRWNTETKTLEKLIELKFNVGNKIRHKIHIRQENTITEIKDTHYILDDELALPFISQDEYELAPDKFDINTLKPFNKVLVRFNSLDCWHIQYFEKYDKGEQKYHFICLCECKYEQCIPYEENKHLLNTTNNCDNYYKTWE